MCSYDDLTNYARITCYFVDQQAKLVNLQCLDYFVDIGKKGDEYATFTCMCSAYDIDDPAEKKSVILLTIND